MVHQERLEIGEKCLVSGIIAVLAAEAALTVITCGIHFTWSGLLLGVFGFCFMLFLANRLYAGDRTAYKIALAWVGFQVLYAIFAFYLLVSSAQGEKIAAQIGASVTWAVVLKMLVYLSLGWVLVRMPTVRDFFAEKRGESRAHDHALGASLAEKKAAVLQGPEIPLGLTANQNEGVRGLAQYLRLVVGALITLGALQILVSIAIYGLRSGNPQALLVVVQGLLTIVLGMALGSPSNEIKPLTVQEGQTKGQLLSAFDSLIKFYKVQVVVGLLLAAVLVARLVVALG
jgi:hypothetical protein